MVVNYNCKLFMKAPGFMVRRAVNDKVGWKVQGSNLT
jgi:hypothetical protein